MTRQEKIESRQRVARILGSLRDLRHNLRADNNVDGAESITRVIVQLCQLMGYLRLDGDV